MSSCGLVYVAVNDKYRTEAVHSIKRAKKVMPDVNITLYSDKKPESNLINEFHKIDASTRVEHRMARIEALITSPYERTIYLDSDTYVNRDIKGLFDMLDRIDIAGVSIPFTRTEKNESQIPGFETKVPNSYSWLNAGVLLYRDSECIRSLFSEWKRLYKKYATESYAFDQIFLREALYESKCILNYLPNKYNCTPKYAGTIYDKPKVIHAAGLDITFEELERVSEVFSEAYTASDSFGISYSGVRNVNKGKIYVQKHRPFYCHFSIDYPIPRKSTKILTKIIHKINEDGPRSGIEYALYRLNRYLTG